MLPSSNNGVFSNYLKTITRNFYRNRAFTLLNLLGLSIGFMVFIYTAIYVYFESHYENFHEQAERIYRVTYRYDAGDNFEVQWARIPYDYINNLPADVPGISSLVRFQNQERKYVRIGENKFRPTNAYVTDKDVFKVFDFRLLAGDPSSALAEPYAIVISRKLAKRYFGDADPLYKEIFVIGDFDKAETRHIVTGVMEDLPLNTHLPVDMLLSYKNVAERSGWAYCYLRLQDGASIAQVEAAMPAFIKKYNSEGEAKTSFHFQPLKDIHLHSNLAREITPGGNPFYVRVAAIAGILILFIAVINFINLNSAMALGRAKEIGMRKVLGANRRQLGMYLFIESIAHNLAAVIIAAAVAYLAFPVFKEFIGVEFILDLPWFAVGIIATALLCGLASGLYPAIVLTAFKPMDVVRSSKTLSFLKKESPFNMKRIMVALQFGISIMLVGSAMIAYLQFRYLSEKNLGMDRDQIIAIPAVPNEITSGFTTFKNHLLSLPGIVGVAGCMQVPSSEIRDSGPVLIEGVNDDPAQAPVIDVQVVDHDFASVLGLQFLAGGNLPQSLDTRQVPELTETYTLQDYLGSQRRAYMINETAMHRLGWETPGEAIGQKINWSIGDLVLSHGPITGVVRDFHQETLKNKVDPIVMVYEPLWLRTFLIKVEKGKIQESIQQIQSAWDTLFPLYPLEYFFLDDLFNNLYKGERVQLQLLYIFSALAVLVAFFGLMGLIAYALKTRVREMAIRKVMGASRPDLIRLISKEYLMVLFIGAAVAIPISYYGVTQWLSHFAYRVPISPVSYFLTVGLIALLLVATVSLQTLRGDRANPAETLRND